MSLIDARSALQSSWTRRELCYRTDMTISYSRRLITKMIKRRFPSLNIKLYVELQTALQEFKQRRDGVTLLFKLETQNYSNDL